MFNAVGRIGCVLVLGSVACMMAGCNSSDTSGSQETKNEKSAASTQTASTQSAEASVKQSQKLAGIWLGEALLDEKKFEQRISQLPPQQQQLILAKAQSFLSMVMAIEFRSDGTVENGVEIVSTDGQILRDSSSGVWKVVGAENNDLFVEIQESLSDGTVAKDQKVYSFSADGDRFALAVPVSEELQGCDARLVFQRKQLPSTNVAEGMSDTQSK